MFSVRRTLLQCTSRWVISCQVKNVRYESFHEKILITFKRYCIPIIYTNVHLPQAVHLKDAMSTKEQFQLRLTRQTSQNNSRQNRIAS